MRIAVGVLRATHACATHAQIGRLMAAQPRRRRLKTEDIGDVTLIRFTDKRIIGEQIIQAIGEQLSSLVEDRQRRKLLLNFANVEYLSSAALGKLIRLNKRLKAAGGRMVL